MTEPAPTTEPVDLEQVNARGSGVRAWRVFIGGVHAATLFREPYHGPRGGTIIRWSWRASSVMDPDGMTSGFHRSRRAALDDIVEHASRVWPWNPKGVKP